MTTPLFDIAIIGGGINGAGIAADAAARGLKVILFEQNDLASATSSASSKLIHGGLRYLEHYEFRLVGEALREREVLLAKAPHVIWPLRFVLPHVRGMRPRALIRAGLFLYDHLARRRQIPGSAAVDFSRDPMGRALKQSYTSGYSYWDCWADDARLVVLNAMAARESGADIRTRTRVIGLCQANGRWSIEAQHDAGSITIAARALVNAAGPWVDSVAQIAEADPRRNLPPRIRLIKGSHIIVPRIAGADDAFLLQNSDGRVVFALPYEGSFTIIGTTDVPFDADPASVTISEQEIDYLLTLANAFFAKPLARSDIVSHYAGVRPLFDDGEANASAVTRDYRLELDDAPGTAPMLTVLGGKLTTYRKLAEAAVDQLAPHFPGVGRSTTAHTVLPGGDVGPAGISGYRELARRTWPELPPAVLDGLIRRYGTRTAAVLGEAKTLSEMGGDLGGGLTAREVIYLRDNEWAQTPEDVLWRRTKTGLHLSGPQRKLVEQRLLDLLRSATV